MVRPVSNPPNPWHDTHIEWLDEPPPAALEVFEERARSILAHNESPDVPFRWSLNPYRGCLHGCAYCYARPSHQHLGFGAGTDFDRKVVVKTNAPEALRETFSRRSWKGEWVMFSGNTDCYQPLEGSYRLTRRCLEVCLEFRNPVGVVTKGALVRRDADVLSALAREASAQVFFSVPFADDETARALEPWASPVARRFEAMRALSDAGVPVGVAFSPVIPGLNESDVARVLTRAREAGARRAFLTLLRLPGEVLPVFRERLEEALPGRAARVLRALDVVREGRLGGEGPGARMTGTGPPWEAVKALFHATCRRLGINEDQGPTPGLDGPTTFRRPSRQGSLF